MLDLELALFQTKWVNSFLSMHDPWLWQEEGEALSFCLLVKKLDV